MIKLDAHHLIIAGKTMLIQIILFFAIIFIMWGAQRIYALIDQSAFPNAHLVTITENMTANDKGKELLDALTCRLRFELDSTFGWSANDILFNKFVLDNRAYRQYGTYVATKMLLDHYSTVVAKLGPNDRENDHLYNARLNYLAISPSRWGILFLPSAEGSYKKSLRLLEQYKQELDAGTGIYNIRTDDIYSALNLILGETVLGYALGQLQNSQNLPFYELDNRIYEAQGIILVVRDYFKAMYDLYPEIAAKGNEANFQVAMHYMDLICTYDPLYVTSFFNSGELIISYLLFTRNRLEDIRTSFRI